ncbi:MAG TPA: energy-dependent translational throttle protein EttA [Planctomycetaceae bacterium]|nr:energy-dependent translational throttle protein EttA [Planctomycetaceae bacterium]
MQGLTKAYPGGKKVFENIHLNFLPDAKIGVVGVNGSGKSTLLRIMAGEDKDFQGEAWAADGVKVGYLPQEPKLDPALTVFENVATKCPEKQMLDQFNAISEKLGEDYSDELMEQMTALQEQIDAADAWDIDSKIDMALTALGCPDNDADVSALSGGEVRRVAICQLLLSKPDMILMDEPTNHLDIPAIKWLEQFLQSYEGTLVFVTHDRVFLQALATRIIEIDRGKIYDWTCDYDTFLKRKEAFLEAEEKQNALFDKKLAEEEVWIRQGIKARRTRNEGRVRALKKMRDERSQRQSRIGNVNMQVATADRSGQLVIEAKNVTFSYNSEPVIQNLTTLISRGDKIGIIGRNGAGKTTLLKLLLGDLKPDSGTIRQGTNLEILYFDQLREQIEEEKTVIENVGEGQQTLTINGQPRNIYGYLQDFLFTPERARRPARYLSGGERNRLLLAKLFKRPTNLMVLDEPTNDLDAETLELLEELICNHPGTLLLVSHDRAFLNNVVTATLVFEEGGEVKEYAGGYDDYLLQSQKNEQTANQQNESQVRSETQVEKPKAVKLSFKEERELQEIPQRIERLEQEQSELQEKMASPEFFKQSADVIAEATTRVTVIQQELEYLLERWEELEARVS